MEWRGIRSQSHASAGLLDSVADRPGPKHTAMGLGEARGIF